MEVLKHYLFGIITFIITDIGYILALNSLADNNSLLVFWLVTGLVAASNIAFILHIRKTYNKNDK